jgi:hypothetical protein
MAAAIPIVAAVVQGGLSAEASRLEGNARSRALNAEAANRELQAQEELRRTEKQMDISQKQADVTFGDQVSLFAKSGVNLSDSAMLVLAGNKFEMEQERVEIERQGIENANAIRRGAAIIRQEARDTKKAIGMAQTGSILGTIGSIASSSGGKK